MKMNGAQVLLACFMRENVEIIFGYPGGAIMPVYDALHQLDAHQIRHILVRHEQGAVHAAEGYARTNNKVGVCIATSGPGATNLVTGIANAMLDSVPLVLLTGQVASPLLGTDAFQEADIIGITIPITKWNYQITKADEIPDILAKAFYIAQNGRPGPVLIDVTKDAQLGFLDFTYHRYKPTKPNFAVQNDLTDFNLNQELLSAAQLINQAKKPYLLIGHGVLIANAEQEVMAFSEKAQLPVGSTLLGLSAFPTHHPLYAGMLGMHGNYGANVLTNKADLIIAVGMRFDDRVTGELSHYAKDAKIIHIDIDPAEFNKNVRVDIAINGDAKDVLRQLIPLIETKQHQAWLNEFKTFYQKEYDAVIAKQISPQHGDAIKMSEVIHQLSQKTSDDAIIVTDVGQHQMITARYYQFRKHKTLITSGGLGTMGFALPAAIGAKLASSKQQVIAIIGDGGFQMNIQELGVIAQESLPVKIIILNNSYLGMVRQWQELFYEKRYSFTELQNPDFTTIAKAYGIESERVVARDQLNQGLINLLNAKAAYLLEIVVEKYDSVFPMIPTGCGVSDVRLS